MFYLENSISEKMKYMQKKSKKNKNGTFNLSAKVRAGSIQIKSSVEYFYSDCWISEE